jgi:ABC-2 type transport system permease protein
MSFNSFATAFYSKLAFLIFLIGKIVRFAFFILFLFFLVKGTDQLAGYTLNQTIFVFLTFSLIDVLGQFLYREVYRFKPLIIRGDFDLILVRPFSALFRSLAGGADLMDLITLPPLIFAVVWVGNLLSPNIWNSLLYVLLLFNGFLITTAFHIAILGLYVMFYDLDYVLWLYRDLLNLGRLPIEIYKEPVRSALTFLIPVAIMITIPAKALMGLASLQGIILSFLIAAAAMFLSLKFWNLALRHYTSASS